VPARADSDRVVVAQFGAAHGVRGEIRLKSFTEDPLAVGNYGPLAADDGRSFVIVSARPAAGKGPDMLVVRIEGVTTRDQAAALNGLELSVPRARLPETEPDEFYHADLIGLDVSMKDGTAAGTVVAVRNFGAGDLIEVVPAQGATFLVPFTREAVPEVDIAGGRIVIDPPPGLLDDGGEREPGS
jgi:16S rRNA processing protein RimM